MSMLEQTGTRMPWWDYLLLPGLSLLTAVAILALGETTARIVWAKQPVDSCLVHNPSFGDRYRPNCTSKMKVPEGPWVVNRYNDCGFRSSASCRVKPPGSLRIAILGTSYAIGHMVSYEQTYFALMEQILSRQCRRTVEVQNLAVAGMHLTEAFHRTDEALALKPDLVVVVLTPYDLWKDIGDLESTVPGEAKPPIPSPTRMSILHERLDLVKEMIRESSALTVIRHFLYEDAGIYLNIYLRANRDRSDYLTVPFSPPWKKGFDHLDSLLAQMKTKTHSQGVPVAIIPSFNRPEVALMNAGDEFPGKNPYAFGREIEKIAERHGVLEFEATEDFRRADRTERLFYVADGHLDAQGQEVLARSISRQILASKVLESAGCKGETPSN